MHVQSFKTHQSRFASVAILIALIGVSIAPTAFARNRITNAADVVRVTLSADNARQLTVSGHLGCPTNGLRAQIRVTVTQRSTGAVAEGSTVLTSTGDTQNWEIRAGVQGKWAFEEGPVTVVYFVQSFDSEESTDANQWLRTFDLIKEE